MKWYGAKMLFRHLNLDGSVNCYEESVRIFQAINDELAERVATDMGEAENMEATGESGPQSLACEFVKLLDVYDTAIPAGVSTDKVKVEPLGDGVEVYATMMSAEEARLLLNLYAEEDVNV